jgi:hypothetical protein
MKKRAECWRDYIPTMSRLVHKRLSALFETARLLKGILLVNASSGVHGKGSRKGAEQVRALRPVCMTEFTHLSADFVTSSEVPAANAGGTTLIWGFPVRVRVVLLRAR